MQTNNTLQTLIDQCSYKDWDIKLRFKNDVPYLQIKFMAPCNMTGEMQLQSCRKWMLSYFMCNEEVLETAYKAVRTAVDHEMREQFKWKGQPIFRPHINPDVLYEMSLNDSIQKRDEPGASDDTKLRADGDNLTEMSLSDSIQKYSVLADETGAEERENFMKIAIDLKAEIQSLSRESQDEH